MQGKTPASVITGFLGAGKTTLIRHLLENARGCRIALIINEFGDLGVDGEILRGCGLEGCDDDNIVELSNGCICCTVAEEFAPTIKSLLELDDPPDHIVIETSGLALPQPLVRAFNWPDLRNRLTVDGVVAVLDAPAVEAGQFAHDLDAVERQRLEDDNLDHHTPLAELFEDQLSCADMVVINKADLLNADEIERVRSEVTERLRPGVSMVVSEMAKVDPAVILGINATAEANVDERAEIHHLHGPDDGDGTEPDHDHDDFDSRVIELPEIYDQRTIIDSIRDTICAHGLLRVKGFASITGKPMRLVVQAVGPRIGTHFDRPFGSSEHRQSRLVVIAEAGVDWEGVELSLRQGIGG